MRPDDKNENLIPPQASVYSTVGTTQVPPPVATSVAVPQEIKLTLELPKEEEIGIEQNKITIFSIVQNLVHKSWFIVLIGAMSFMASFLYFYREAVNNIPHTGTVNAMIMFDFANAEQGLDPLGNPINPQAIRSPYVINRVLDAGNFRSRGLSPENIRSNLVISAVAPLADMQRLNRINQFFTPGERMMDLIDEIPFNPTQYVLSIHRRGPFTNFTNQEMVDLLSEIIEQYRAYFTVTYHDITPLSVVIGHINPLEQDYFQMVDLLIHTVGNMISHVEHLYGLSPDFRSPNTNRTFGDILTNLQILRDMDISVVSSLIHTNSMSRDRFRTANVMEYQRVRLEMQRNVAMANAETALEIADEIYQPLMWFFNVDSPSAPIDRHDPVYPDMLRLVQSYRSEAVRLDEEIRFLQNRIDALRGNARPASPADVAFVEQALPALFMTLEELELIINETTQDFLRLSLFNDAIRTVNPPAFVSAGGVDNMAVVMSSLIGGLVGIFLGALIVVYRHMFSYENRKRKENPI